MSLYGKSIWVFHLNTGSCNSCDIEILDVLTPYHDVERFGIKLVASPRHADALLLTGPITRESLPKVAEALMAVPEPKLVIAIGSCACGGGIWYDTYSTIGGLDELYRILREEYGVSEPPTVKVPGCPPKPESIIYGVALALGIVRQKVATAKVSAD
ncbi:MAG: hypothetical protein QXH57_03175 [Sulfolobales archaeon]